MQSYQVGVSNDGELDDFQQLTRTIEANIKKISQNVSTMGNMIRQLQTTQDSHEVRTQLRQMQNYSQAMSKETSALVIQMMNMPVTEASRRLTRSQLRDDFMAVLNSFQVTQKWAAQKTKDDVRQAKNANFRIDDAFNANSGYGKGSLMDESGCAIYEQVTLGPEIQLEELEERERNIIQLERDIIDVNEIFKELGTMIHAQAGVIDSIESNVEYASHSVEVGNQELRRATTYKNRLRKKKIYLAIILSVIVLVILILIFYH